VTALAVINGVAIVVLVLVTAYYAWQTHEMAQEMRHARLLSLLPKLVLDVEMVGPTYGLIVVRNVGAGPALDVDLHLLFGDTRTEGIEHRQWLAHVIAPGEPHQFLPPEGVSDINGLVGRFPIVSLRGELRDALNQAHEVNEQMNLQEWWLNLERSKHRWQEAPADRLVRELEESRKELGRMRGELTSVKRAIERRRAEGEEEGPGGEPNA
jgi:hypothetical protein